MIANLSCPGSLRYSSAAVPSHATLRAGDRDNQTGRMFALCWLDDQAGLTRTSDTGGCCRYSGNVMPTLTALRGDDTAVLHMPERRPLLPQAHGR
jgi:hypothetical protein